MLNVMLLNLYQRRKRPTITAAPTKIIMTIKTSFRQPEPQPSSNKSSNIVFVIKFHYMILQFVAVLVRQFVPLLQQILFVAAIRFVVHHICY